jgi:hypothetical protein
MPMPIGSTTYFVIIWTAMIGWGLSIAVLAVAGLLRRRWVPIAVACAIAAGGLLLSQALVDVVSD